MKLDAQYWNKRYQENDTPWDIGHSAPAILRMVRENGLKNDRILFPGAGLGHEAQLLRSEGFKHIYICDWAEEALVQIGNKHEYPKELLLQANFFEMKANFDLIVEMTFFCALEPNLREDYVKQSHALLNPNGKLTGLLFNKQFENNPPFGGNSEEYSRLFEPYFNLDKLQECTDSIPPRLGWELEILFSKKN